MKRTASSETKPRIFVVCGENSNPDFVNSLLSSKIVGDAKGKQIFQGPSRDQILSILSSEQARPKAKAPAEAVSDNFVVRIRYGKEYKVDGEQCKEGDISAKGSHGVKGYWGKFLPIVEKEVEGPFEILNSLEIELVVLPGWKQQENWVRYSKWIEEAEGFIYCTQDVISPLLFIGFAKHIIPYRMRPYCIINACDLSTRRCDSHGSIIKSSTRQSGGKNATPRTAPLIAAKPLPMEKIEEGLMGKLAYVNCCHSLDACTMMRGKALLLRLKLLPLKLEDFSMDLSKLMLVFGKRSHPQKRGKEVPLQVTKDDTIHEILEEVREADSSDESSYSEYAYEVFYEELSSSKKIFEEEVFPRLVNHMNCTVPSQFETMLPQMGSAQMKRKAETPDDGTKHHKLDLVEREEVKDLVKSITTNLMSTVFEEMKQVYIKHA